MLEPSREVWIYCERRMEEAGVPASECGSYRKWLRYYLDFCVKYGHRPREEANIEPFSAKLESKGQTEAQKEQAKRTIRLMLGRYPDAGPAPSERQIRQGKAGSKGETEERRPQAMETVLARRAEAGTRGSGQESVRGPANAREGFEPGRDGTPPREESAGASAGPGRGASWVRAYQALEAAIRMRNYSTRTLQSYRHWVRMFQAFTKSKATDRLDAEDVKAFLSDLAVRRGVAGSTQNQAFNALLVLYRQVLGREFGRLDGVVPAKRRPYVPVVLSRTKVEALFEAMGPPYLLVAQMLYGCGLRLSECRELRVQCMNLDAELVTVHDGKGQKDRTVPLPKRLLPALREQLKKVGGLAPGGCGGRVCGDVSAAATGAEVPERGAGVCLAMAVPGLLADEGGPDGGITPLSSS